MQEKTADVEATSLRVGLKIHRGKTKVMRGNTDNINPISLGETALEDVEKFTYLGSIVDVKGGTDADIKARIGKARTAFCILYKVWTSKVISRRTKIRIFNSNVKSVLLYGAETWRTTQATTKRIQTFINSCLRQILRIHWPERISNTELWRSTEQQPSEREVLKRKWRRIGHTLRKPCDNITRYALKWNPQGKRKRGRPRNTWRRDLDADTKSTGYSWTQLEKIAQDRVRWKAVVDGLCSSGS